MKITSRILSVLLVLAMALSIVPVGFVAEVNAAVLPTTTIGSGFANNTVRAVNDIDTFVNGIPSNATLVTYVSDIGTNNIGDGATKYLGCFANTTSSTQKDVVFRAQAAAGKENTSESYAFTDPNTRIQLNTDTSKNQQEAETGYYYREVNGERWYSHQIRLGGYGTLYKKGLGVNATTNGTETAIVYNIPSGTTHFYAVVGNCGANGTNGNVTVQYIVQVRAGNSGSWTTAATVAVTGCQTGEFLVDLSGFGQIRLSQKTTVAYSSGGRYGAWGNASFLKIGEEPKTNVAFESALSVLTGWYAANFAKAPAKVYYTYKNVTTSTTVNSQFEGYYTGVLEGVAAKEMSEKVSMYLADASGNPMTGTVSNSIRDYAIKYLTTGTMPEYKAVAGSMLDYGAAVQNYFQYNIENPANDGAPAYEGLNYQDFIGEIQNVRQGSDKFFATNLRLEDEINLMFYFQDLPENCTAIFEWNGVQTDPFELEPAKGLDGILIAELTTLPVVDYRAIVTCTVKDADGNVVAIGQDSVASYALRALSKGDKRAKVCEELLEYAEAVVQYKKSANHTVTADGTCSTCHSTIIPAFNDITNVEPYNAGQNNFVLAYSNVTSVEAVATYEAALKGMGYTLVQENTIGDNRFVTYKNAGVMVHCSYYPAEQEYRITYGPETYMGATTEVAATGNYAPSVTMLEIGGTGLSMVVQLTDGSFIIIDGGFGQGTYGDDEIKNADKERLYNFLMDNTPEGTKPQITWMITHAHSDHILLPTSFINEYADEINVTTVCYNFPDFSVTAIGSDDQNTLTGNVANFMKCLSQKFPLANHYITHTGNKLYLPGCEIEFLFTASEDLAPLDIENGNATSNAWRMTINGKTILITGDIETRLCEKMVCNYGNYMASNVLQVVHHGINGATQSFYDCVTANKALKVCFWPIRQDNANVKVSELVKGTLPKYSFNKVLSDSGADYYFQSETTTLLLSSLEA